MAKETLTGQSKLSHIDERGQASMVDVSDKEITQRTAMAEGYISMSRDTLDAISNNQMPKGDVFAVARIAGIQAAKQCGTLIPLCHPLMLTKVGVDFEVMHDEGKVKVNSICRLAGKTGVEMEALTAVSVAALTLFDMCKAMDPSMIISDIRVVEKVGGKTGHWQAQT